MGGLEVPPGVVASFSESAIYSCDESEEPGYCNQFAIPTDPRSRLIAFNDQLSVGAEKFRFLSSRLKHLQNRNSLKILLVTSSVPEEGKTVVAANLAITLASHQQRTLLIDGDLRHASTTQMFDLTGRTGLLDWWKENLSTEQVLYKCQRLPLWLLPSASHSDEAVNVLQSSGLQQLVSTLSTSFTWIIIDSPPLSLFADAVSWSATADGIVFVARRGITPLNSLRHVIKTIDISKVLAVVLNEANVGKEQEYYAHYYMKRTAR